jgi:hypothetical protein
LGFMRQRFCPRCLVLQLQLFELPLCAAFLVMRMLGIGLVMSSPERPCPMEVQVCGSSLLQVADEPP